MKRCVLALAGLIGLAIPAVAEEIVASPWLDFREARVRLLAVVSKPDAPMRGAVEIRLANGYKTYWRTAGDSGVPPLFDFTKSTGLGPADVGFPFPSVFDDGAGGKAWGYKHEVLFPLTFPRRSGSPGIALKLDFAVCGTMCIPLSGEITLDPAKGTHLPEAEALAFEKAVALLPRKLAGSAEPAVVIHRLSPLDPPQWTLRLADKGDVSTFNAFPEANGFLEMTKAEQDSEGFIRITLSGQAAPGSGGKFGPVRLTYGRPGTAFERTIDLDGAAPR